MKCQQNLVINLGIEGIETMQFGSGVLGAQAPVDGGFHRVMLILIGTDGPLQGIDVGVASLGHALVNTLNSIPDIFNQLGCLGVW